jgi:CDP-glucose 4,6-dehydratase
LSQQPSLAGPYNFGPDTNEVATVRDVVELAAKAHGSGRVHYPADFYGPHEAGWLTLEIAKARNVLGVVPRWTWAEAVHRSMTWYRKQHEGARARALCESEIAEYEAGR